MSEKKDVKVAFLVDQNTYDKWMQIMFDKKRYFNKSDFFRDVMMLGIREMENQES